MNSTRNFTFGIRLLIRVSQSLEIRHSTNKFMPFTPQPHFSPGLQGCSGAAIASSRDSFPSRTALLCLVCRLFYNGRGGGVWRSPSAANTHRLSSQHSSTQRYLRPCPVWARSAGWMDKMEGGGGGGPCKCMQPCALFLSSSSSSSSSQGSMSFASAHTVNPSVYLHFFTLLLLLLLSDLLKFVIFSDSPWNYGKRGGGKDVGGKGA